MRPFFKSYPSPTPPIICSWGRPKSIIVTGSNSFLEIVSFLNGLEKSSISYVFIRVFYVPLNVVDTWKLFVFVEIDCVLFVAHVMSHCPNICQRVEGRHHYSRKDANEHLKLGEGTLTMIWLRLLKVIILDCSVQATLRRLLKIE